MRRALSATYRNDLAALRPSVSEENYLRLERLAHDVLTVRQREGWASEDLDAAVDAYLAFRNSLVVEHAAGEPH